MILVLGASGYIGRNLLRHLEGAGLAARGTCCSHPAPGLQAFDLARDPAPALVMSQSFTHAVLCSGAYATIDGAKRHFDEAYAVNVLRTRAFIGACIGAGVAPVYVSTDNVFDGRTGNYREEDPRNPVNAYGRMRLEVETHLMGYSAPWAILRVGKVFGLRRGDGTLLTSLLEKLERSEPVRCATDQHITPVEVEELCGFIALICRQELSGVYHVASTPAVSPFGLATQLRARRGLSRAQIEPCEINGLGLLDRRPVNTSLDASRYRGITGREVREMESYFGQIA